MKNKTIDNKLDRILDAVEVNRKLIGGNTIAIHEIESYVRAELVTKSELTEAMKFKV